MVAMQGKETPCSYILNTIVHWRPVGKHRIFAILALQRQPQHMRGRMCQHISTILAVSIHKLKIDVAIVGRDSCNVETC